MSNAKVHNDGPGDKSPRSIRFLSTATAMCVIAAFVLTTAIVPAHVEAAPGVTKLGSFQRPTGLGAIAANGSILLNPQTRRGYQISKFETTKLYEFDLDTLTVLREREIPPISQAAAQRSTDWFWIMDTERNRILFLIDSYVGHFETDKLAILDLATLEINDPKTLWPLGDGIPLSFSYNPPTQRIYMIVRNQADAFGAALRVEERDLEGNLVGQEHPLPKCLGALDDQYPATSVRSLLEPNLIYLNCYGSNRIQSQIVRIDLGTNGQLDAFDSQELFPALPGPLSTLFDPGSDRMFFLTANKGAGRGAWVFDGLRDSFLGVIATGDSDGQDYSMGLDESTGRIYMQTPGGLVVADGRRTPLPGRLVFKDFKGNGFGKIQIDAVKKHVFVADVQGLSLPTNYSVLKDSIPLSVDPNPGDPDSLTADIDERPGITDVNLAAGARAFALRSLTTGGAQRAGWNVSMGGLISPEESSNLLRNFGVPPNLIEETIPLDPGNRDLYLSRVRRVAVSGKDTEASAIFAESDEPTRRDLNLGGQDWPFDETGCVDGGGSPKKAADPQSLTSSSCDSAASAVWATSGGGKAIPSNSLFSVSATASSGMIYRDAVLGLVAISEAVIEGISIADVVRIGELRTVATTWAKGRKGSAGGSFERRLGDVSVDTDGDGRFDFHCGYADRVCDVKTASAAIGKALEGKASITFPEPDQTFSKGSPGGYQAVIQKNSFQAFAERSLNDDDSPEVVGMQVVYFADAKAGRSRQILQLAGVQAESHYGIYQLPNGSSGTSETTSLIGDHSGSFNLQPTVQAGDITAAAPVLGVSKTAFDRVVEKIAAGWRFLLANTSDALKLAALWTLFLLPLYLIGRRRFITV